MGAFGTPPIDPTTNGNPLLEWERQTGQQHPLLAQVRQKMALSGTASPTATTPTLAPPQVAPPPLTSPSAAGPAPGALASNDTATSHPAAVPASTPPGTTGSPATGAPAPAGTPAAVPATALSGSHEIPHGQPSTALSAAANQAKEPFIGDKNWDEYAKWEYDKDVLQKQNPGMTEGEAEHILTSRHGAQVAQGTALSAAPNTPAKAEYDRLVKTGSGESQIKNPWARVPLQVLDAIGSAFFPSLTMGIPGTQLHHDVLVNQGRRGVTEEADVGEKEARAEHERAEAEKARTAPAAGKITNEFEKWIADNPQGKLEDWEKFKADHAKAVTVATPFEKWMKDNPDKKVEDWLKVEREGKPEARVPTDVIKRSVNGASHNILVNKETGQDIADMGEEGRQQQGDVINREVGGKPHNILVDKVTGRDIADLGERGKNEPAENAGTWTFAVNGKNENVLVNTKTGQVRPAPDDVHKLSGLVQSREAQGKIIKTAGDALLQTIEKHRDKLGNLGSYWRQFTNGTPISDPDTAGLMAQLGSFAALQPSLHGFRGQQALAEFEKIIGGVPKNPDALEAAIKAIQGTAGIVESGGTAPGGGADVLPGGISLKDIDAEIERRKKK